MRQSLDVRPTTGLVITPQMRQALKLLQLSGSDLMAAVAEEVERNPLLELDETGARGGERAAGAAPRPAERGHHLAGSEAGFGEDRLERLRAAPTLREHLMAQSRALLDTPRERLIGAYLVGMVDDAGYLRTDPADTARELNCAVDQVADVLETLRKSEPAGVFARDLADCLSLQLADRGRLDPAMAALVAHLDAVAAGDRAKLRRACGVGDSDLDDLIAELRALDPKPGLTFGSATAPAIMPDILVARTPDGDWEIELNPAVLPRLIVNNAYRARVSKLGDRATNSYLTDCFQSANWLLRALHQRSETILKVAAEIVRRQAAFLDQGIAGLRPLVLRDVAEAVGLHESTISRATNGKYLATPRGTFELRYFFTVALGGAAAPEDGHSAEFVRHRIRRLVADETSPGALSDERLAAQLSAEGIDIARRTVAKYRDSLGIGSSAARRRAGRLTRA